MPAWGMIPILIVAGGLSLLWAVRKAEPTKPERLTRVILGAFGLRVLLALALFGVSYWKLPVLASWQLGDGFWVFNGDAPMNHYYAASLVDAWRGGMPWPNPRLGVEYFLYIAAFYGVVGPHPLHAILLNCWMGAATGLLAYLIGRRIFTPHAGLLGAILVSFWPSALLWSAQLSKDPPTWFFIFAVLWLVMRGFRPAPRQQGWSGWAVGLWLALAATVFLLSCIRQYTGWIFALCALLVLAPAAIAALLRREIGLALRGVLLVCIVGGSVWMKQMFPIHEWVEFQVPTPAIETLADPQEQLLAMTAAGLEPALEAAPAPDAMVVSTIAKAEGPASILAPVQTTAPVLPIQTSASTLAVGAVKGTAPRPPRRLSDMVAHLLEVGSAKIAQTREGFLWTGGSTLIDTNENPSNWRGFLVYLPRALMVGFLAPFPSQWFDASGSAGSMRSLAACEMLGFYLLLPALGLGFWHTLRRGEASGIFLLAFILLAAIPLSLAVANIGTLFRLRLQFLLPLLIVTAGGLPAVLQRLPSPRTGWKWPVHLMQKSL